MAKRLSPDFTTMHNLVGGEDYGLALRKRNKYIAEVWQKEEIPLKFKMIFRNLHTDAQGFIIHLVRLLRLQMLWHSGYLRIFTCTLLHGLAPKYFAIEMDCQDIMKQDKIFTKWKDYKLRMLALQQAQTMDKDGWVNVWRANCWYFSVTNENLGFWCNDLF